MPRNGDRTATVRRDYNRKLLRNQIFPTIYRRFVSVKDLYFNRAVRKGNIHRYFVSAEQGKFFLSVSLSTEKSMYQLLLIL